MTLKNSLPTPPWQTGKRRYGNYEWRHIPKNLRGGIRRYVDFGIPPGGFLTAVISNDLRECFHTGTEKSLAALENIVAWFYLYAPAGCWGSPEAMRRWLSEGPGK